MRRPEVFLSHSTGDRRLATRLARALRRRGIQVWYSRSHLKAGQQWHDEIGRALARCRWFLVLLSPSAVRSKWVKHEVLYALREDRYVGRIVPLLCRPCDEKKLSWTLGGVQRADFTHGFESGLAQLFAVRGFASMSRPRSRM